MQCPKCQHDMIESHNGWLCLNCGHLEPNAHAKPLVAQAAPAAPGLPPSAPSKQPERLPGMYGLYLAGLALFDVPADMPNAQLRGLPPQVGGLHLVGVAGRGFVERGYDQR